VVVGSPSPATSIVCAHPFIISTGGDDADWANAVQETKDGGYIVVGAYTFSASDTDALLLKFDGRGDLSWASTAGDVQYDEANSVAQTSDGGYIVAGSYGASASNRDIFLLKYASNGGLTWAKRVGGNSDDEALSVQVTSDSGYVVAGFTKSYGAGGADSFLLKFASNDSLTWAKTAGGAGDDKAYSVAQTSDDGYIVTGLFGYSGTDNDILLLKYASDGSLTWAKGTGGLSAETGYAVQQITGGGYLVAGFTESYGAGNSDAFLVKYASDGTLTWARTAGQTGHEVAQAVVETSAGEYILTGETNSFDGSLSDAFLFNYSSDGMLYWAAKIGGSESDKGLALLEALDGYVLAGETASYGEGGRDVLLAKMTKYDLIPNCSDCTSIAPISGSPSPPNYIAGVATGGPSPGTTAISPYTAQLDLITNIQCDGLAHIYLPLVVR